jgi:hypothetical protein
MKKNQIQIEESSFRDPSGQIFYKNNRVYRLVNKVYRENYDLFVKSGLKKTLEDKEYILKSKVVSLESLEGLKGLRVERVYKVLETEKIPFISYPYEWSFSQLQDAALLTLKIQNEALKHNMILKDASVYNIQFYQGKAVFIDILSFEKYKEGLPWVAYRQFCQHFLAPLSLMSYKDVRFNQFFKFNIDGIPLDFASELLPKKTWFDFSLLTHIHLHAKTERKYADKGEKVKKLKANLRKEILLQIIKGLENKVSKLKWDIKDTQWGNYYTFTNYSKSAFNHKKQIIKKYLKSIKSQVSFVWDLGANTGEFSRLASNMGINTLAFDIDPLTVEKNYIQIKKQKEKYLLPLIFDATNPSPGIGWQNTERKSLIARGPTDCIFALALTHHLVLTNNVPFLKIAEFFAKITNRFLIIEFVPKDDSNAKKLLTLRKDIFVDYNKHKFESVFRKLFDFISVDNIKGTKRIIYLMKKK